jgi:amino acid transporter
MNTPDDTSADSGSGVVAAHDAEQLARLGYTQELARRMSGFSNLAISLSIICVLAGGLTSFHLGYGSVGGAAIGVGWPLASLMSLAVAAGMAQLASAFPTAGGLYHWASILGGRGWGWMTAWYNLVGLVTVLAAINVGAYEFLMKSMFPDAAGGLGLQWTVVGAMTASQAWLNHKGIRLTTRLTDFSGYWILAVSTVLMMALLWVTPEFDFQRLVTFSNFSGLPPEAPVWPAQESVAWLFALGFLLPAYTITGFDASAHVAEETLAADVQVPQGIVRSVLVSGIAGWILLSAIVLAIPDTQEAARQGPAVFFWTLRFRFAEPVVTVLCAAIFVAQYLCGLATVTSASRMAYAFARDGGLPKSNWFQAVHPVHQVPVHAIWAVSIAAFAFTVYSPVYSTITAVCTICLYVSYVLPAAIGLVVYRRSWTQMGPWDLGRWFRPIAALGVLYCTALLVIGVQPPNEKAIVILASFTALLVVGWFTVVSRRFQGPPEAMLALGRQESPSPTAAPVEWEGGG